MSATHGKVPGIHNETYKTVSFQSSVHFRMHFILENMCFSRELERFQIRIRKFTFQTIIFRLKKAIDFDS